MSQPRPPRRRKPPVTTRLQDVIDVTTEEPVSDREKGYYAPHMGDWFLLALLVVVLLGNGLFIWVQVASNPHVGRAVFFGLVLLCILWASVVYTFKLSVGVRVGPHGMSIVRGPWRTEMPWREVARLVERVQVVNGQRYRWVVVLARDERRLQVREDMVADYPAFRIDVYRRYRLWRERGGTWGAAAGGPFTQRETTSSQAVWWGIAAATTGLPGIYFAVLLPETGLLGPALLVLALICGTLSARAFIRRNTYTVDAKAIEARSLLQTTRLAWRDVTRVERTRLPFGGIMKVGVRVGRFTLWLADRGDARLRTFGWSPRVPEYLTLRGTGRQVRIALHRVGRPDELLAWVEFYERLGRRATASEQLRRSTAPQTKPELPELPMPDFSSSEGPADPWGGERDGAILSEQELHVNVVDALVAGGEAHPLELEEEDTEHLPAFDQERGVHGWPAFTSSAAPPSGPLQHEPSLLPWEQSAESSGPAALSAGQLPWEQLPGWPPQTAEPRKPAAPRPSLPFAATPAVPTAPQAAGGTGAGATHEQQHDEHAAFDPLAKDPADDFDEPATPWRHEESWRPPQLPRYGPPSAPQQHQGREGQDADDQFSQDQFLR